jgi:thiamine biosynthesis lipoprotein ApbE
MRRRSALLIVTAVCAAGLAAASPASSYAHFAAYTFGRDNILGTSLDLTFTAPSAADAEKAESAVLAEVERLRRIISNYDDSSDVSRLASTGHIDRASPDLIAVLDQYAYWNVRSDHAYSPRVGALTQLWKEAAINGRVPADSALAEAVRAATELGWRVDRSSRAVVSTVNERLDLSSLGKGYIIDHAMKAAMKQVPSIAGGIVNIGGDIHVWGRSSSADGRWRIGIVDPRAHADNAAPLATLRLTDAAVSTSGSYLRGFDVGGRHYSHIIDPRTGQPSSDVIGVTVIAHDNATANALATTLSVVGPDEGLRLIESTPGAEALLTMADGSIRRSRGFAAYEEERAPESVIRRGVNHATLSLDITPNQRVRRRPYVAVWITNASGAHVRTLAMWGDRSKYQRDLSKWWGLAGRDNSIVDAVTRATRNAGKYELEWDGLDQRGTAVPAGMYTFWVEAAYQNGPHSVRSATVVCGAARATGAIEATDAFAAGSVVCTSTTP